jgi:hypothetical protein
MIKTKLEIKREKEHKKYKKYMQFKVKNITSMGTVSTILNDIESTLHKVKLDLITMSSYAETIPMSMEITVQNIKKVI